MDGDLLIEEAQVKSSSHIEATVFRIPRVREVFFRTRFCCLSLVPSVQQLLVCIAG